MSGDDLLSFKEFSPVHGAHTYDGSAQIAINSPNRTYGSATTQQHANLDPLDDLINSMSTSVNVLHNENRDGPDSGPAAANVDDVNSGEERPTHSIFTIEYYQRFFNVDAGIVRERILSAIIPRRASVNYLKQEIGLNPDLYGPFWIVVTLIFSIAISGNIASYLQSKDVNFHWRYNFHLVSFAATTIVVYVSFIPLILWCTFKWTVRQQDTEYITNEEKAYTPDLLSLMCLYGYSLGIYIPVSMLWTIQFSLLQWLLVFGAAMSTGAVLIIVLSPALQNSTRSVFLIGGILAAHFLLAVGFMLHFFHTPTA